MKEKKKISFPLLSITSLYICFDAANIAKKIIAKNKLGKLKFSYQRIGIGVSVQSQTFLLVTENDEELA